MAGLMVGGAFLGSFLNVVFDKLASPEVVNFIRGEKLSPLFKRLKITLTVVNVVLNDAEKKQFSDPQVNKWLDELKHVVYMADDLLDEVATKAAVAAAATQKEVTTSNFFSGLFNTAPDGDMATRLTEIVDSLELILKLKESLGLKETAMESVSSRILSRSVQGGKLYGRDEDKKAIIKLFSENNESEQVSWIPIVGMGGVGKTTLAQMVYNDEDVKQKFHFNFKAWVCVSDSFDIMKVVKSLTEALTQKACEFNDPNILQEKLVEMLKEKKFLIVLDDVWIQDYSSSNNFKQLFQCGMRGSKILLTTRSKTVASLVQTVQPYRLSQLSYEDSWLVFANHACLSLGSDENTTSLEQTGREIVKKCDGLPLAAQSLGGSLRATRKTSDWNNVLNSDIWTLSKGKSEIIPSLRVSYDYLHPDLKRCFLYCSLYPKDVEFEKNDMIQLWMAEDLLPLQNNGKTLEEVGDEYFDDLLSSSFLQRSSTPEEEGYYFGMHDLMHDLATFLGGKFYFRSNDLEEESTIDSQTRHLSFIKTFSNCSSKIFGVLGSSKFLRTILRATDKSEPYPSQYHSSLSIELSNLECLRVLSYYGFKMFSTLPDSIGGHIHLRYLDFSRTGIKSLPESICNLYNLQTLKLEGCENLTMLPSGMQNLVNLHYLGISKTKIEEMPKGMNKLNQLQHLSYFIVGKHEEIKINELGGLSNLHGSFAIKKLENVENGSESLEARMMDKKHIQHLKLYWSSGEDCMDSQTEMDILCKLEPHQELESLEIVGYRGTRYPDWVGKSCFPNMTRIKLFDCNNCFTLPSLGHLPSLRYLTIFDMKTLETIDGSFFNNNNNDGGSLATVVPFPSLEFLEFGRMPCWEVWSCSEQPGAFPLLKCLIIKDCPKLKGDLPSDLPALEYLKIRYCPALKGDLPSDLPALEEIDIRHCEQLTCSDLLRAPALSTIKIFRANKVMELVFPEGGMSPALTEFKIDCRDKLLLSGLAWSSMDKLTHLDIRGPCVGIKSFPNISEGFLMPPSLKSLKLVEILSLETLDCKGLLHLTNLQTLSIWFCPKLEIMAGESLPASLSRLVIYYCHLLGEQCRTKDPHIWPKISHIQDIRVDGRVISE